jgi:hypothetical protein
MSTNFDQQASVKPHVLLVAEPEGLAINLTEQFLANFCRVKIFSDKTSAWNKLSEHLRENRNFDFTDSSEELIKDQYDYALFISGSLAKIHENNIGKFIDMDTIRLKTYLSVLSNDKPKSFAIFPFSNSTSFTQQNQEVIKMIQENYSSMKIIYVGNLIGPRSLLSERNPASWITKALLFNGSIDNYDGYIYPVDVRNIAKSVTREVFSFSQYKEIALIGSRYLFINFVGEAKRIFGNLRVGERKEILLSEVQCEKKIYEALDLRSVLKDSVEWYSQGIYDFLIENQKYPEKKGAIQTQQKQTTKTSELLVSGKNKLSLGEDKPTINQSEKKELIIPTVKNVKVRKFRIQKQQKRLMGWLVFLLISLVLIPFIFLATAFASFGLGYWSFRTGNINFSQKALSVSDVLFERSGNLFYRLSSLPFGNNIDNFNKVVVVMDKSVEVLKDSQTLASLIAELTKDVTGQSPYSIEKSTNSVSLELDSLYRNLSFLEGEVNNLGGFAAGSFKSVFEEFQITEKRQMTQSLLSSLEHLPEILGAGKEKKYLIVLQNNYELRATGGKIAALMLVTFNEGRLTDVNVIDAKTLDSELRGSVKPPDPIRNYLGEENWLIQDSNWDPDFTISAARAEWFLDKIMGIGVDGVVAIDLKLLTGLLEVTGPVKVDDATFYKDEDFYNELVRANMKSDLPLTSENNRFMSELLEKLPQTFAQLNDRDALRFSGILYQNLMQKHLQVAIHDPRVGGSLEKLNWNGGILSPQCTTQDCKSDWFGVVESNFGRNLVNYKIEREAVASVEVTESVIRKNLKLIINNSAGEEYKVYLRLITPVESTFADVKIVGLTGESVEVPSVMSDGGVSEAGVWLEVSPLERKVIEFSWSLPYEYDLSEQQEYALLWRKQAGVDGIDSSLGITVPGSVSKTMPQGRLTGRSRVGYNTTLSEDQIFRVYW